MGAGLLQNSFVEVQAKKDVYRYEGEAIEKNNLPVFTNASERDHKIPQCWGYKLVLKILAISNNTFLILK